jgi:hypothetical protein
MPRLTPCPTCHSHVLADSTGCPHCGATLRSNKSLVPAVLVGLALAGCPAEPEYGVPDTGPDDETGTATAGTETGETETTSVGEPEYGVPATE